AQNISLGHYTHEKSPVGCAAAQAVIDYIKNEDLLKKVKIDGDWIESELYKLQQKYAIIHNIRGIGLLWGMELRHSHNDKSATEEAEKVMYSCLEQGLSFKVSQGNVLQLSPALTIERHELERALEILDNA